MLKQSLQRSEEAAFWMKQKAEDVMVATKLDAPLKQLDAAAAAGLTKMEETQKQFKTQLETTNR